MREGQNETDGLGKSALKHPFWRKRRKALLGEWDGRLLSKLRRVVPR
jgi:hypothetical protein